MLFNFVNGNTGLLFKEQKNTKPNHTDFKKYTSPENV